MIEIKNVSFTYDSSDTENLHDISMTVKPGECVLLCGRSGCGKTSVLRLINGLVPHFYSGELTGTVTVNGMNISETPMYKISEKIGTVYQNPRSQFFNIDTNSEIAFGIENLSYPREELFHRVSQTIEDVNMSHLMNRSIFELSGGEKQKVAFASIYAMKPDIFLLDEPSANLDAVCTEELRKRIKFLKQQGKTVIISEHRLYYLHDIADRIIYMDRGEIKNEFTAEKFYSLQANLRIPMGLRVFDLSQTEVSGGVCGTDEILSVQSIASGYKKKAVIEDISFTASLGDIIAIMGHNGAGKSTLAETLCGLNKALNGQVLWKGKAASEKQRLKLSYMVMQDVDYQLFAESVENECHYGLQGVKKEDVDKTLTQLSLAAFRDKHPNTLSGGQKQRLAVAVSMVCQKKILIFDEPTSGLDLESMGRVTELIKMLSAMGKVIFVVTHDYEFICKACNRMLQVEKGRLIGNLPITVKNAPKLSKIFLPDKKEGESNE